jgi:hypothetical protein
MVNPLRVALLLGALLLHLSLPASGEASRIVVISDINGRYGSTGYHQRVSSAVERIIAMQPDLVISTGDMVAGQRPSPKLQRAELETMWRNFHRFVRQPLEGAGIPVLMTPGNHDASVYPGFELEREAYTEYHADHPPGIEPQPAGRFPYHYATEYRGLLLISLDATASGPLPAPQREWLATALEDAGRYHAVLVFGHLPLQPVATGRERDVITDPELESLIAAAGVKAYLSGHHHAYYPGRRGGVDMLSMGNLGGNQRKLVGTNVRTGFSFALLEIDARGVLGITAYLAPHYERILAPETLPPRIGSGDRALRRRDVQDPG